MSEQAKAPARDKHPTELSYYVPPATPAERRAAALVIVEMAERAGVPAAETREVLRMVDVP